MKTLTFSLFIGFLPVMGWSDGGLALSIGFKTTHMTEEQRAVLNEDNEFVGVSFKHVMFRPFLFGYEASTFVNSYDIRSYSLGLSTGLTVVNTELFDVSVGASYGVINGFTQEQVDSVFLNENTMLFVAPYATLMYRDTFGYTQRLLGAARSHEVVIRVAEF